jgi:hypothetical protein
MRSKRGGPSDAVTPLDGSAKRTGVAPSSPGLREHGATAAWPASPSASAPHSVTHSQGSPSLVDAGVILGASSTGSPGPAAQVLDLDAVVRGEPHGAAVEPGASSLGPDLGTSPVVDAGRRGSTRTTQAI